MRLKTYLNVIQLLSIFLICTKTTIAQNKKQVLNGASIHGIVKISSTKTFITNAKVAVHNTTSGVLIASTQTDKEGCFTIPKIPIATSLELRITYSGYMSYKKIFVLKPIENNFNFGTILLNPEAGITNDSKNAPISHQRNSTSTLLGAIIGKVRDSTYKYVLNSATVSVYNQVDSSLLKFTIPNDLGEFNIGKLPLNLPLKLLITHIGYTPYKKIFTLNTTKNTIDFDWIYMHQNSGKENLLEEVKITSYAPVRMNGDTLEFNPRAFKMDANATTEDLMRILPGMVIWGDGDITFNGKKINSLLVDGKPFMGGSDFTTATQNLPVDVLDKVQVYSQRDEKNPLDSTLNANLKLKEDKKTGYFSKIGGGYGSNNRFATDGMLSGYNKKMQISTVGAFNNTNKSAANINTLIRSNSYKGQGNTIDYQSDFKRAGINIGTTAGTRLQYDFISEVSSQNSRRLITDYFFKRNNETINNSHFANTTLKTDSILSNNTVNQATNINTNNSLSVSYDQKDKNYSFKILTVADIGESNNLSKSNGEQIRTGTTEQLSTSKSLNSNYSSRNNLTFNAEFQNRREGYEGDATKRRKRHLLSAFTIGYKFDYEENEGHRHNLSSILSTINPASNKSFDRLYQHNNTSSGHTLNVTYPNLKKLIFGFANLGGISLDLSSTLAFNQDNINALVFDTDDQTQKHGINGYLTNNRNENVKDIQPKLVISKNFDKGLTNRYRQRLGVSFVPIIQYYSMQSLATQQVQNFSYQYRKFIPRASLSYYNHQYGTFEVNNSLNYSTHVGYPTVNHIAPLVDSANVWYIPKGNPQLRPEYTNTFAWQISLESRKPKNPYGIDFNIDASFTQDKISDSTFYDNIGRRINYEVNLTGNKYWHLGGSYRKAYSPNKSNTFRFNFRYNRYHYYTPSYLDALLITSDNDNNNFEAEITYSFLDIVNINAKQGVNFYKNLQRGSSQRYEGLNKYSRFSSTLQLPKNLTWGTNINFNTSKAENRPTVHYAIWNASVTYRFMKGNRGEINFSALDLLKQNKSVINITNRNVQTFGFNNVLQQYFMFGLAYYPRKFGK